jgi:hypothetical protein
MAVPTETERAELEQRRAELRAKHLRSTDERDPSPGAGIHHASLICSDPERTIEFYQGLLGFPLIELLSDPLMHFGGRQLDA